MAEIRRGLLLRDFRYDFWPFPLEMLGERDRTLPLLIASCAPCDGPDGLPTSNGSAGITVAESASAAATIAADFIRRFSPDYLRRQLSANAGIAASRAHLDHLVGAGGAPAIRVTGFTAVAPKGATHAPHEIRCCRGLQSTNAHSR